MENADSAEQNAEDHADQRAGEEANEYPRHADRHIREDLAAHHHRYGSANHLERRRDQEWIEYEGRQQLPNQESEPERRGVLLSAASLGLAFLIWQLLNEARRKSGAWGSPGLASRTFTIGPWSLSRS